MFDNQVCNNFVFGLERVPLPCVVTDNKGEILWSNDLFLRCIAQENIPTGQNLSVFVKPEKEETTDIFHNCAKDYSTKIVLISDKKYSVYLSHFGLLKAMIFAPFVTFEFSDNYSKSLNERIVQVFNDISHALKHPMAEQDLLLLFINVYEKLFPGRLLCIKLFDNETLSFQQVYANGRLREESRSHVRITKLAQTESALDNEDAMVLLKKADIWITKEYLPVFEDAVTGFDVPLYDGTNLFGLLHFEYVNNAHLLEIERGAAITVANQMCVSIRNTRVIAETTLLKDYLAKIVDQAATPIAVLDRDRSVLIVNRALEVQTGRPRDRYLGNDFISFVAESERQQFEHTLLCTCLGEKNSNQAVHIVRENRNGNAEIVFDLSPVISPDNDVEGVILVGRELSEFRSLQEQIIHTEKLATLGQVAAGVAHEVSNPLTFIAVYANYLLKKLNGVIEPSDIEKIKRIIDASTRIQTFTRELVAYGRPSKEKPSQLDLGHLIKRALSFCEHLIDHAKAAVVLEIDPNLGKITGISGHMEQVFVNLITNACHSIEMKNGGQIRMSARMESERRIIIETEDNGAGILPENLDLIFEPFFTTKPEGLGTGLGLSIVRNILTEHKGDISVKSKPGQGALFTVRLPVRNIHA